jgi:glycosyltransferase involved in cell wall biosynthesis
VKQRLKALLFGLLRKDPEAVVATFCSGPEELTRRMAEEVRALVPERRHFVITESNWPEMRARLKRHRIGLAPVMLAPGPHPLRRAALRLAPRKLLAYNTRLERHHLRLNLASFLFWRGVPLDRIYLRPRWWPWPKRERSVVPAGYRVAEGRACAPERRRIAVLSPYVPYPLSHGGAVRIFNLLRETAREFDIELFAFQHEREEEIAPLLEFCARVVLVEKPRYREPRWSTALPPEVLEYRSPAMREAIDEERRAFGFELLQIEYAHLAEYGGPNGGDVLVEHDVNFDLFGQIARVHGGGARKALGWLAALASLRGLAAYWDYRRWRTFERHWTLRYRRVVVMSKKDAALLGPGVSSVAIGNGVDMERFQPAPEQSGQRLLFIGSFQHFPNVAAYRFFTERVWPLLRDKFPAMTLDVACGRDHLTYWRAFADSPEPPADPRIRLLGYIADVRPLYEETNLVIVPTTVSAGTNVKVLEAMAMRRAVVSTESGCAGLDLLHGYSAWIADSPSAFAAGIATLITNPERRAQIAEAAQTHAARHFDWRALGEKQRAMLDDLLRED